MEGFYIVLILIFIGGLVKLFPNMLAGYSQLTQRERDSANENRLPKFVFVLFATMGLLAIAGYLFGIWLDYPSLGRNIGILVTLTGAVVLIIIANRFTGNLTR